MSLIHVSSKPSVCFSLNSNPKPDVSKLKVPPPPPLSWWGLPQQLLLGQNPQQLGLGLRFTLMVQVILILGLWGFLGYQIP